MSALRRPGPALLGLAGLSFCLTLAALWVNDAGSLRRTRALSDSLHQTEAAGQEASAVRAVQQLLVPQAALIDGRRGEALESLRRAADSAPVDAWAAGRASGDPRVALAALFKVQPNRWLSAALTDKAGRVVAVWPQASAQSPERPGLSLNHDPYFLALSDPGMGPGIVRHGYEAPAAGNVAQLVAACGVADPAGNFAGLLKVRIDAGQTLFGGGASPFQSLTASYPGAVVLLALGDGKELYSSAKGPFSENLAAMNGDSRALLAELLSKPAGSQSSIDYGGQDAVAVWQRVGSAPEGAAPSDVMTLVAFVPRASFAVADADAMETPAPFYRSLPVLLLLALAVVVLSAALRMAPAGAPAREGSGIGAAPAASAPSPPVPAAAPAGDAAARSAQAHEETVKGLRKELSASQTALRAVEARLEEERKAGSEARTQKDDLRSALEISRRDAERAAAEKRSLEAQVGDLRRAQVENLKPAAKDEGPRLEREAARLAAVNALSGELKATLEVIKTYINKLLGGQGAINDGQQEFLGVVINKSARLERQIGDLVEISEIGSGVKPLSPEALASAALVQDVLVSVRPQAENKNISIELTEAGGALSPVYLDREKIEAVLRGLLNQAVKVSPRNDKILLQLGEKDACVELRITDSGMNLPAERAAKVFVQFHGVDSQAGPEFIGSGLRFPIFKSVLEAQGGTIAIESQAGRGKTFVLGLPKAPVSAAGTPVPAASAPVLSPLSPPPFGIGSALGQPGPRPPALAPQSLGLGLPPPGSKPLVPGLPPLGPLPAPIASGPPAPSAPPALTLPASLATPPAPKPKAPADEPSAPPVIYKPAPVDEALNAPWKRKDSSDSDELGELMGLSADTPDFEKVFGTPSALGSGALPKVELTTGAKPSDTDLVQFSSVFGSKVPPAAPSAAKGIATDFDALFSPPTTSAAGPALPPSAPSPAPSAPKAPPAAPAKAEKPALAPPPPPLGLNTLDDLNELLGQ